MQEKRNIPKLTFLRGLKRLKQQRLVIKNGKGYWHLTPEGKEKGARVVRLHRLWELYLTQYLNIASDHVHEDAESIEHILTPELEAKIQEQLNFPELDPHASKIP